MAREHALDRAAGAAGTARHSIDPGLAGTAPAGIAADIPGGEHAQRQIDPPFQGFIGTSPLMQDLYNRIEKAARSQAPVFIMGETGTGKDVCAETIHRHSRRAGKPFIAINCAAIPRDLLESELFGHVKGAFTGAVADRDGAATLADGGTLFLDEVAEMAADMQTKLLRFLQDFNFRKVGGSRLEKTDIRLVCATNRDPAAEITAGRLREDLFFRLHVIPLTMPPLRARGSDIPDIALTLLRRYSREEGKNFSGFSEETNHMLQSCSWPGNIRELQNIIRCLCVMHEGPLVTPAMLPPALFQEPPAPRATAQDFDGMTLAEIERHVIETTIARMGGNVPLAAAHLGMAPSTLYRRRLSWGDTSDFA